MYPKTLQKISIFINKFLVVIGYWVFLQFNFLHPEHHIQADGESVEVCMNLIKALKESGYCSSPGQDDHRQTGRGAGYVYICVCVYVRTRVGGSRRVYYG